MVIELRGVEFVNKGAELMLHAILKKLREELKEPVFVMDKGPRTPVKKLRESGIYVKLNGTRFSKIGKWTPKPIRRQLGFVLEKEVQVVLDGSGFAFGDQWGSEYAERRLGSKIVRWREQGKKIILLPQAFGPFRNPELKDVMGKILIHSDLVFAREKKSLDHLKEVSSNGRLSQAPDFTNLIKGRLPKGFDDEKHQVAVIPNYKMLDKAGTNGESYFRFLVTAVTAVRELNLRPYFLIHEGKGDADIAEKTNARLEKPVPVIFHSDPLVIKGIISSAYFIICSRFHGVVSALSQGVPCLATSWSHKYEMLLREYDYAEGLIKELDNEQQVREKIKQLSNPSLNSEIAGRLFYHSRIQQERSKEMWQAVFEVINT